MIDKFKGKTVKLCDNGRVLEGIIVGFSTEKGLTIIRTDDTGRILLCVSEFCGKEVYEYFENSINCGIIDIEMLIKEFKIPSSQFSVSQDQLRSKCNY